MRFIGGSAMLGAVVLVVAPATARPSQLTLDGTFHFRIEAWGIYIGRATVTVRTGTPQTRVTVKARTTGVVKAFFPAVEYVVSRVREDSGLPDRVLRRYRHGVRKGAWRVRFDRTAKRLRATFRDGDRHNVVVTKIPPTMHDPISSFHLMRSGRVNGEARFDVIAGKEVWGMTIRPAGRELLYIAGASFDASVYDVDIGPFRKYLLPQGKPWKPGLGLRLAMKMLSLSRRAGTRRPSAKVYISDDKRRIPLKVILSDPRGTVALLLERFRSASAIPDRDAAANRAARLGCGRRSDRVASRAWFAPSTSSNPPSCSRLPSFP